MAQGTFLQNNYIDSHSVFDSMCAAHMVRLLAQAGLLMVARLAALLDGSDEIARRVLPLLASANAAAAPPHVRATAAFALACVAGACARGGCRCAFWAHRQGSPQRGKKHLP